MSHTVSASLPTSRIYDQLEAMPRPALAKLQEERLLAMLPYAYEKSRLVRTAWDKVGLRPSDIRSMADFFAKVPFLDKDMIRAAQAETGDPFGGQLCIERTALTHIGSSSGTTGDPTFFAELWKPEGDPDDPETIWFEAGPPAWLMMWVRAYWEFGLRPGDYVLTTFFRLRGPVTEMCRKIGVVPIMIGMAIDAVPSLVEASRTYRPKFLFALNPALVIGLEQFARETGVDMTDVFASYNSVIWLGEPLSARNRALLESWGLGKRINEQTSFGDTGVSFDCHEQAGFHAAEDAVIVECLDPVTGKPVPDGARGELVLTQIVDRVDPLIRYRTGDLVELNREPCRCGRTHARYKVFGRTNDEVVIQGRSFLPSDVRGAVETIEETQQALFQIIRKSRTLDRLRLRVGYAGQPDLKALEQRVVAVIREKLGLTAEVMLVPNEYFLRFGAPHKVPRTAKE